MKNLFKVLMLAALTILPSSCLDNEADEAIIANGNDTIWYEVTNQKVFTVAEFVDSLGKVESGLKSTAMMLGSQLPAGTKIRTISYNYKSFDGTDTPALTSGLLIVPELGGNMLRNRLYIDNRATQTENAAVPTNRWNVGSILTMTGSALVTADLMGWGTSANKPINYCCYDVASRNTVDAAVIAQQMLQSKWLNLNRTNAPLPVINEGYSQGGFDALAVQKYLETEATPYQKAMLPLIKSFCGAGPYSLNRMMDDCLAKEIYMYGPYLITGLMSAMSYHKDMFKNYQLSDYIDSKMFETGIVKMLESKQYGNTDIVGYYFLSGNFNTPGSYAFSSDVLDKGGDKYKTISKAFEAENLCKGWKPQTPIYFFHAMNDDCVPVGCTMEAQESFGKQSNVYFEYDETPAEVSLHSKMFSTFLSRVLAEYFVK